MQVLQATQSKSALLAPQSRVSQATNVENALENLTSLSDDEKATGTVPRIVVNKTEPFKTPTGLPGKSSTKAPAQVEAKERRCEADDCEAKLNKHLAAATADPVEGKDVALELNYVALENKDAPLKGSKIAAAISPATCHEEWIDVSADVDEAEWTFV